MPWKWVTIRGQRVLARAHVDGSLAEQAGRVEIRYKLGDARAYRAAAGNLGAAGDELLPDDACPAGEEAPPKAAAKLKASAASPTSHIVHHVDAFVAYTDGACKGNPGNASASCIVVAPDGSVTEEAVYLGHTTNNVAELTGVAVALAIVPRSAKAIVHTDSSYAIGVLSKGWKAKANQEIIAKIKAELKGRSVEFVHVRGHSGIPLNERADELANIAIADGRSSKVVRPAAGAHAQAP
jgi:ribonuclease HI